MTFLHSAIIFINTDLTTSIQSTLTTQLMLSEIIDGYEFDSRVAADPNYPTEVHLNKLRVMVMRSGSDLTNRNLADLVLFVKAGLAYVESNKYGTPGQTYPVAHLQLGELLKAKHGQPFFPWQDGVQSNILYPLFPHRKEWKYPFGTDPICAEISKGLLVDGNKDCDCAHIDDGFDDDDEGEY